MTVCKLAGIPIAFHHRYPQFRVHMQEYLTEEAPLLSLSVSDEEIAAEMKDDRAAARPASCESLALYRKLCTALPLYGGFFLHAALLSVDGVGVAITARSGVGKSTHAALWRDMLADRCSILNGDKPLFRRGDDGHFYGYGTPFAGKEGWHKNASVRIGAVLLLERAEVDSMTPLAPQEAFPALYAATLTPRSTDSLAALLPLLADFSEGVRFFRAAVTKEPSAAACAYAAIFG